MCRQVAWQRDHLHAIFLFVAVWLAGLSAVQRSEPSPLLFAPVGRAAFLFASPEPERIR